MKNYTLNKGFIMQNLNKKIMIFDPDESVEYTFNETAAFVFKKMKAKKNVDEIVAALVKKYKIDPTIAAEDIKELILELLDKKIIQAQS